jgi:hypothetical protein
MKFCDDFANFHIAKMIGFILISMVDNFTEINDWIIDLMKKIVIQTMILLLMKCQWWNWCDKLKELKHEAKWMKTRWSSQESKVAELNWKERKRRGEERGMNMKWFEQIFQYLEEPVSKVIIKSLKQWLFQAQSFPIPYCESGSQLVITDNSIVTSLDHLTDCWKAVLQNGMLRWRQLPR